MLNIILITIISLIPTHTRTNYSSPSLTEQEKKEIVMDTKDLTDEQIFWYGITKARDRFEFARKNDLQHNKANCVGYAAYAKQIMDYGLKVNGYHNRTFHYVGYLKTCGVNINKIVMKLLPEKDKNFFKDHDFVGIEMENGRQILFSPSLYDKFNFGCWTEVKK